MKRENPAAYPLYSQPLALLTDLYQLTMAYSYWKEGLANRKATFNLFFRKRPFRGSYAIAAGLEMVARYIENFCFDPSDIAYLATLRDAGGGLLFESAFLNYLVGMKMECSLDAVPEGTPIFPHEPILRVTGPIIQAQLLESPLLNLINFQTLVATKASRICRAAAGESVVEFGMRRAQGPDGALTATRGAYIGGCSGTSHLLAGKLFGIPVKGTHAHSWIMAFGSEEAAFDAWAAHMPTNCIFLVDTYDTIEGVKSAIRSGLKLRARGYEMIGVRLDSGDLAYLSIETRKLLDSAGFPEAQIMASNELDEHIIQDLKRQGAKITVWGVGTSLVTGNDQPALDGVYKLAAIQNSSGQWEDKLKLSQDSAKTTNPGLLQIRRFELRGRYYGDMIFDERSPPEGPSRLIGLSDPSRRGYFGTDYTAHDLLVPILREGKSVYTHPPLAAMRQRAGDELAKFDSRILRFLNPEPYYTGFEEHYFAHKIDLIQTIRGES